jgi:endoglucanase
MTKQTVLPRWRGFNLLNLFTVASDGNFKEEDFQWISEWGFDFVRIPMTYTQWIEGDDVYKIKEEGLAKVDRVVRLGQKYGVHVDLSFHRAPGFSVNPERKEPFNLWKDEEALKAFCFHWALFTKRYKGISSKELSFNLVNEPTTPNEMMSREDHERVIRAVTAVVRKLDTERLIIADGISWGNEPLLELSDLDIAQSCRSYLPMGVSHYRASWVGGENWPVPVWPGNSRPGDPWDRSALEQHYKRWTELAAKGIGIHCGEGGAYSYTPHDVFLNWFRDVLEILKELNIGYALWNFTGGFGVLDSERADVAYEDWHGHKLDKKLLKLLQQF